ncbi:MAG: hypothetical protein HC803_04250 [Saprospiraceae bacterium]|nr:hypothetical protein [Saprospiraceae bacterium]
MANDFNDRSATAQKLRQILLQRPDDFVSERGEGIHVINNIDPTNPQSVKFIKIPGAMDIAIKGNILYADNYRDLVALDISDLENIRLTKRIPNLYPKQETLYPRDYNGYFECVDTEKGIVIGWLYAEFHAIKKNKTYLTKTQKQ